ncbi:MAG: tetratricopeptide repeat protein, partial [Bacteroidota bacterium]
MVRYPLAWLFVLLLCTCVRAQKSNWDSIRFFRLDSLITENGWQDSLSGKRVDTLERLLDRLPGPRYRATYALRRGVQLRRAGSSVAGREYLEAAIAGFRTVADSANIAKATYNLARTYLAEGNYERAFALYEDALYRYRNLGDVRMEINALESLGVTLRRTEQPDRALEYYEKAYDRARALEDRDLTVGALINRAIVHKRKNEFSRAIDLYLEGLTLVSRPPADPRQTAYLNLNLSSCYSAMNRYEAALDYAERAYAWFVHSGSARERSMNLVGLAVNYNKVGQQELTVETAREALRIVGDETGLSATIHETMADAFTAMNRADSAFHHLKTAT